MGLALVRAARRTLTRRRWTDACARGACDGQRRVRHLSQIAARNVWIGGADGDDAAIPINLRFSLHAVSDTAPLSTPPAARTQWPARAGDSDPALRAALFERARTRSDRSAVLLERGV